MSRRESFIMTGRRCGALLLLAWLGHVAGGRGDELTERLATTRAVNLEAIVDAQFEQADPAPGFRVPDPYGEQSAQAVFAWGREPSSARAVCAVRFVDEKRRDYLLRDFPDAAEAANEGYVVTHKGRCGTCSTLQDLAIYLATPDLTTPARQCARRFGLERKKTCFQETIGFTAWCAESWAYNAQRTRQQCLGACASDYGLLNLLFNRYPGENTLPDGRLRPCLQCDEDASGPGFKYSAGRTRRNSGIVSDIRREAGEIYPVDHGRYFETPPRD